MKKIKLLPLLATTAAVATTTPLMLTLSSCGFKYTDIPNFKPTTTQPTGSVSAANAAKFYFEDSKNFISMFKNDWFNSLKNYKHVTMVNETKEEDQVDSAAMKDIHLKKSSDSKIYLVSCSVSIISHTLYRDGDDKSYTNVLTSYVTEYTLTDIPYEVNYFKQSSGGYWIVSSLNNMSDWKNYSSNWSWGEKINIAYSYKQVDNGKITYSSENTYSETNTASDASQYLEGDISILNITPSYYMEKITQE